MEILEFHGEGGNGAVVCVSMCAHACVFMYYMKLKKQLQMFDTFQYGKAIGICTRDRGSALPV